MEIGRGKNRMKRKELIQGWHMQRARLKVQGREIERLKHEQEMTKLTCDTVQEKYEGEKIRVERLKKETEWLINECASLKIYDGKHIYSESQREYLKTIMKDRLQEALNEG